MRIVCQQTIGGALRVKQSIFTVFQICLEQGLCVTTCLTALIGFFISVIYGVANFRYCTPVVSDHVCIYTAHITEHKILATVISLLTLVAVSNSVLVMCCSCANGRQMIDICSQRYGPLMKSAGNQGVSYQATSLTSEINKDSQSCTASPTGAMSRSSDYSNMMGQAYSSNPSVEELRNRKIDYQNVQLSVPHQRSSHETEVTTPMNTPPPSYEDSVSEDDVMIHLHKLDKIKPQNVLNYNKNTVPRNKDLCRLHHKAHGHYHKCKTVISIL